MTAALICFAVLCLSAAVVCTMADGDDLDLWEPANQTNEEDEG